MVVVCHSEEFLQALHSSCLLEMGDRIHFLPEWDCPSAGNVMTQEINGSLTKLAL